jgi:hypothetical protein
MKKSLPFGAAKWRATFQKRCFGLMKFDIQDSKWTGRKEQGLRTGCNCGLPRTSYFVGYKSGRRRRTFYPTTPESAFLTTTLSQQRTILKEQANKQEAFVTKIKGQNAGKHGKLVEERHGDASLQLSRHQFKTDWLKHADSPL